jgi:hypothetical protein
LPDFNRKIIPKKFIKENIWIEYFLMLLSNFDELLGVIEKKLYIIIVLKYLRNLKNLNEFKTFIQINNKNNY